MSRVLNHLPRLSVTHGTPPLLKTSQHDVPKPASLPGGNNEDAVSPIFAALVSLCDVLDTYLERVFDMNNNAFSDGNIAISTIIERQLSHWKDSLPYDLRRQVTSIPSGVGPPIDGAANVQLAYLYVILIARKLGINNMERILQPEDDTTLLDSYKQHAVSAAESIVNCVHDLRLNEQKFCDFYLPFAALCISDTVAFLIRSALYPNDRSDLQERCLNLASDMITSLKNYRRIWKWDLGDICLARYAYIVEAMATTGKQLWKDIPELREVLHSDFAEVDQMAPKLWDMYNGVLRV